MSVESDLRAARALIVERFMPDASEAIDIVTTKGPRRHLAYQAVRGASDPDNRTDWGNRDSVLARFDRAIEAASKGKDT